MDGASAGTILRQKALYMRKPALIIVILVLVLGFLLLWNFNGWKALVLARVFRTYNPPVVVQAPPSFQPKVPDGFKVSVFATGFKDPRWLAVAPNGDVFVADSAVGKVIVLRSRSAAAPSGSSPRERVQDTLPSSISREVFADGLKLPFGIAFQDNYVYIAATNKVVRFPYDPKTSKRTGDGEKILDLPGFGYNQHWTRSLAFSPDGKTLFVSVGSGRNVAIESDPRRAAILAMDPDGKPMRIYASGLRNAVGLACNPESGMLWTAVNERDDIGDNSPSDYFTHVVEGEFYGWPYVYDGQHVDNRVSPNPAIAAKAIAPDVPLGAHVAPLQVAFYEKQAFPSSYQHGAFIAEHGSWNRSTRSGYQVVFVPFFNGSPSGPPQPFFSGFVPDASAKQVYGRPVGVAVAQDGSLLISDDGANLIWKVSYAPAYHWIPPPKTSMAR